MAPQSLLFYAFRDPGLVQVHQIGESAETAPRLYSYAFYVGYENTVSHTNTAVFSPVQQICFLEHEHV